METLHQDHQEDEQEEEEKEKTRPTHSHSGMQVPPCTQSHPHDTSKAEELNSQPTETWDTNAPCLALTAGRHVLRLTSTAKGLSCLAKNCSHPARHGREVSHTMSTRPILQLVFHVLCLPAGLLLTCCSGLHSLCWQAAEHHMGPADNKESCRITYACCVTQQLDSVSPAHSPSPGKPLKKCKCGSKASRLIQGCSAAAACCCTASWCIT